jgi:predicted small lipoprotein YifL
MNKVHGDPSYGKRVLALALLASVALGLAGCGVRGSLEAPPAATTETGGATPGTPGQPAPHKPSILDPLLR